MIAVPLIAIAGIILLLKKFGIIKRPLIVFLIAAAIIITYAYLLKGKSACPFIRLPF